MSDTHTSGRMAPNSAVTTALPRLGWMTCSTARVPMNTDSYQFLPLTRTEVSSEQTTGLASTTCSIAAVAFSSGSRARAEDIADGPLADRQREEFVHQQDQPFHANGVGVMEIHRPSRRSFRRWRSRLQTGRRRGGDAIATTGATAAEQAHLGHIRANRGQLDALIDLLQGLRRVRKHRLAFRAGGQPPVDRAIRVRMQRPTDTGAALARRATCTRCREVWLVSLRGRPR